MNIRLNSSSYQRILRRIKKLEESLKGKSTDGCLTLIMWTPIGGGIFGHIRYQISGTKGCPESGPLSEEEEIDLMHEHYERERNTPYFKRTNESFLEYLERFSYLGPEEYQGRRKEIISQLKQNKKTLHKKQQLKSKTKRKSMVT